MLTDPRCANVLRWSPDGKTIIVLVSGPDLEKSGVLGEYFKSNKYRSFDRQMNLYGFKRSKTKLGHWKWRKEGFVVEECNVEDFVFPWNHHAFSDPEEKVISEPNTAVVLQRMQDFASHLENVATDTLHILDPDWSSETEHMTTQASQFGHGWSYERTRMHARRNSEIGYDWNSERTPVPITQGSHIDHGWSYERTPMHASRDSEIGPDWNSERNHITATLDSQIDKQLERSIADDTNSVDAEIFLGEILPHDSTSGLHPMDFVEDSNPEEFFHCLPQSYSLEFDCSLLENEYQYGFSDSSEHL